MKLFPIFPIRYALLKIPKRLDFPFIANSIRSVVFLKI